MLLQELQRRVAERPLPLYFGGSFNPFHRSHRAIVEALQITFPSCPVTLLPNRISPLKLDEPQSTSGQAPVRWPNSRQKVELMQAVLRDLQQLPTAVPPRLELCELQSSGPSYTADTLRRLLASLNLSDAASGKRCLLTVGWDSFCSLPLWKDWHYLTDICIFVVFRRAQLAAQQQAPEELTAKLTSQTEFILLDFDEPISSTELRQLLARRKRLKSEEASTLPASLSAHSSESVDFENLLGPAQWAYIQEQGLYC